MITLIHVVGTFKGQQSYTSFSVTDNEQVTSALNDLEAEGWENIDIMDSEQLPEDGGQWSYPDSLDDQF